MTDFLSRLKALTELEKLRAGESRPEQAVTRTGHAATRAGHALPRAGQALPRAGDALPRAGHDETAAPARSARMSLTDLPLDSYPLRGLSDGPQPSPAFHYRDDLDGESVRLLALHARQQLSIQALSIANAEALDVIGLFREEPKISLM